jgi:hypothetical protein
MALCIACELDQLLTFPAAVKTALSMSKQLSAPRPAASHYSTALIFEQPRYRQPEHRIRLAHVYAL